MLSSILRVRVSGLDYSVRGPIDCKTNRAEMRWVDVILFAKWIRQKFVCNLSWQRAIVDVDAAAVDVFGCVGGEPE